MSARYGPSFRFVVSIVAIIGVLWLFLSDSSPSEASDTVRAAPRTTFPTPTSVVEALQGDDEPFAADGKAVCGIDTQNLVAEDLPFMPMTVCSGGSAGGYPCNNIDLMSFLPLAQMGGSSSVLASSVWGWTDPQTGREYALVGLRNKTSFVDITDAANPVYLGYLPTHTGTSSWRELKTYNNYVFIVSDNNGNHGIQIFDLTRLRNVTSPPVAFTESAHYGNAGSIHNIWVNQATGYAYAVGTSSGTQRCSGGVHIVNVQNPLNPTFAACYPGTTTSGYYTHDIDCMVYNGPDADYQGHEICVASDGKSSGSNDSMAILDVTNKNAIVEISRVSYASAAFIHQTDFTEDMNYLVLDDELDESNNGTGRRTHIYNMTNLDSPQYIGYYQRGTAIDHNQYVKGGYLYQANYTEGLNVYSLNNIGSGSLSLAASFDIYPSNNNATFNGAWNIYPYFNSGNVVLSGIEQGLFVLRPNLGGAPTATPVPPTPTRTPTGVPPTATRTPTGVPPTATRTPTGVPPTATRTPTPVPPTATPSGGYTYTGTLSGTGASQYRPDPYYQVTTSGTHTGSLTGPAGTDFDLYLQKWNGSSWATVKSSLGSTSTEYVTYSGTAGYYRWRIYSYSGSGNYTLVTTRPAALADGASSGTAPIANAPEDAAVTKK